MALFFIVDFFIYELFSLLQLNFSFAPSIIISSYLTCSLLLYSIISPYLICSLLFSSLYKPPSFIPPFLGNYSSQMFLIQWKQWLLSLIVPLPWDSLTIRWKIQVHHFFSLFRGFNSAFYLDAYLLSYFLSFFLFFLLNFFLIYLLTHLLTYLFTYLLSFSFTSLPRFSTFILYYYMLPRTSDRSISQ